MKNLLEFEKNKEREEREHQRRVAILGRDYRLPAKLKGISFTPFGIVPEVVLQNGGYHQVPHNGWVRNLTAQERFHAFIGPKDKIYLHHDQGKHKHKASGKGCDEERVRLEKKYGSPRKIKKVRKYHDSVLTREAYLEAMAQLKQAGDNPHCAFT